MIQFILLYLIFIRFYQFNITKYQLINFYFNLRFIYHGYNYYYD
jgi:hypothetical protein